MKAPIRHGIYSLFMLALTAYWAAAGNVTMVAIAGGGLLCGLLIFVMSLPERHPRQLDIRIEIDRGDE